MATLDNRHTLALPYWARPGLSMFAKKATGSSKADADDDDDEDDDTDDDDDDEDDDELANLSEDELRAELKKTQASLSKASGSSAAKRKKIAQLNRELDDARKPKKAKTDDDDDTPDLDTVRDEARREERKAADERTKKSVARAELKLAGVPAERVTRAVGLLTLDDLDVTDEGEVDGLDDALDELRKEWPELFPKTRKRRESVAGDTDDGKAKPRRELSASERQARAALAR